MKKVFLSLFLLLNLVIVAQDKKTCDSPQEDVIEELNSITKCTIKPSKKNKSARQISVRVSAPKKRFLKKRSALKRETITGANKLNASGVADTKKESELLSKSLKIKKNVASISNTLSAEEVRAADKFSTVDQIPTFKKCKNTKGDNRLDCFNTEMIKHIEKHFNYPSEAVMKKIQGEVWVRFIIDSNGNVTNIKTLGPENGDLLNEEAKRVVSNLDTFIPGTKKGKSTSVKYGFPINFSLE